MNDTPIRVLLVDDQALLRRALETLLNRRRDIAVVGHAANGAEALAQVQALDPDVVLMDIRMPVMDGVEATRRLTRDGGRAAVIILTTFEDDEYVFSGLAAGARGYLLKDSDPQTLTNAIRTVARGEALLPPDLAARVLQEFRRLRSDGPATPPATPTPPSASDILTSREQEILRLLGRGHTNQEIGDQLALSIGTVKNHVSSILAKLGARDRVQALILAREWGLI